MPEKRPFSRSYLFLTVFVAGMSTLAIEFTTSRMLQTVYGTSNLVWANVIGLVLLFLTLGYFLGGRLADKRPFCRSHHHSHPRRLSQDWRSVAQRHQRGDVCSPAGPAFCRAFQR